MFATATLDALTAAAAVASTVTAAAPMPGEPTPDVHAVYAVTASGLNVHVCSLPASAFPTPDVWAQIGACLADGGFVAVVESLTFDGVEIVSTFDAVTGAILD